MRLGSGRLRSVVLEPLSANEHRLRGREPGTEVERTVPWRAVAAAEPVTADEDAGPGERADTAHTTPQTKEAGTWAR